MSDNRQQLGIDGERLACAELKRRGYTILAQRYRARLGEIDVIAGHDGVVVFVEVKTRTREDFGGGAIAVTQQKQRTIVRVAQDYLVRHRLHDVPCRFDVVVVDVSDATPRVDLIPGAFDASG
jgi:putative endonuclease